MFDKSQHFYKKLLTKMIMCARINKTNVAGKDKNDEICLNGKGLGDTFCVLSSLFFV